MSIAPMMEWTDKHCRFFHRLLTRRALLYSEMVTTGAVLFGPRDRLLGFDVEEHPVALQLGGSDPNQLAKFIVDQATGQQEPNAAMRKEMARWLGARGGQKGGPARAAALSPSRRAEIAKKAAQTRWKKKP